MNSSSQIRIASFLSYIQIILSIAVTLFYTPYLIKYLGNSEYGLYSTIASAMSMLMILSLGFNSAYIKFYSRYNSVNDIVSITNFNGLILTIFITIGVIAFFLGIAISNNLKLIFQQGLSNDEVTIAQRLVVVLSIYLALYFPGIVFNQIVSAHESFIVLKTVQIFRTLAIPIVSIFLLRLGYKSISVAIATLCVSATSDLSLLLYSTIRLKARFTFFACKKDVIVQLFCYTFFIAINLVIDQINWNLDKVILGRYCGTTVVAVYSIGSIIHTCFQRFSISIASLFTPRIHNIIATNSTGSSNTISLLFTHVGRIQFIILAFILSLYVFWGKSFIVLWVGNDYTESFYIGLMLIIAVLIPLIQNLGIEIQRAKNIHRYYCVVYFFISLINTFLTILLAPKFGAIGAAIGTMASVLLGEGLVMNLIYKYMCKINILFFWCNIFSLLKGIVLPIICGLVMSNLIYVSSFFELAICSILYFSVYSASMWFFGINNKEKSIFKSIVLKIRTHMKVKFVKY